MNVALATNRWRVPEDLGHRADCDFHILFRFRVTRSRLESFSAIAARTVPAQVREILRRKSVAGNCGQILILHHLT
jgi:hypothetical protein